MKGAVDFLYSAQIITKQIFVSHPTLVFSYGYSLGYKRFYARPRTSHSCFVLIFLSIVFIHIFCPSLSSVVWIDLCSIFSSVSAFMVSPLFSHVYSNFAGSVQKVLSMTYNWSLTRLRPSAEKSISSLVSSSVIFYHQD